MTQIPLKFSKFHGTGNDFIMIDNRNMDFDPTQKRVAFMCHRHFGIGADGLILIEKHPELAFTMRYFNADGRESTMCGNGGRCAVAFAQSLELFSGDEVTFMAADGIHQALIRKNMIRLKMQDVLRTEQHEDYFFIDTGSPHYVTFIDQPENIDVEDQGRQIRYSDTFQPGGTNVNFVHEIETGILFNRTYERGVEKETLSCGTGSVAAAISAVILRQYDRNSVTVRTLGGELTIYFKRETENSFTHIWLEGPATFVFSGSFNTSDIQFYNNQLNRQKK